MRRIGRKLRIFGLWMAVAAVSFTVTLIVTDAPRPNASSVDRPNIIFVQVTSLRSDRLGVYGYRRNTTPTLESFARGSAVFDNAVAQGVWTYPSTVSLFTSQYIDVHGVRGKDDRIRPNHTVLPEVLRNHGYQTAGFQGSWNLRREFGFDQGFDRYVQVSNHTGFRNTVPAALNWLDNRESDRPFFLFLHSNDMHDPWTYPPPYCHMYADDDYNGTFGHGGRYGCTLMVDGKKLINFRNSVKKANGTYYISRANGSRINLTAGDIRHVRNHYDGGIRYTDNQLSYFFRGLKRRGLYNESIIVFYATHGENLGEHHVTGYTAWTHWLPYYHTVQVPLIIRGPGISSRRIDRVVELIDVAPTILELVGITPGKKTARSMQGESLVPLMQGNTPESVSYAFSEGLQMTRAVRTAKWKLIEGLQHVPGPSKRLFNLRKDPRETRNVIDKYPEVAARLQRRLEAWELNNTQLERDLTLQQ